MTGRTALASRRSAALLAHALPQPLQLRPDVLAAEFLLEPGDRIGGGVGTHTRQTLGVSRTGIFLRDRRGPRPAARRRLARGLRLADGVEDRDSGNRRRGGRDAF